MPGWVQLRSRVSAEFDLVSQSGVITVKATSRGGTPREPAAGTAALRALTSRSGLGWATKITRRDLSPNLSQLRFADHILQERAVFRNRTHLDLGAVSEAWAPLGDGHSFIKRVYLEQKVTADCFFRFGKGTIRNQSTVLARADPALQLERAAAQHLALGR